VTELRDEFLSEEDLDLVHLAEDELIAYWNLWLEQAQASNELDRGLYSHGVFARDPAVESDESGQSAAASER
jgi:ABC-type ATPase with predicted acetyltransferase domain